MNYLCNFIVILLFFTGGLASTENEYVPGNIINNLLGRSLKRDKTQCDAGRIFDCSTCSSRIYCNFNQEIIMTVNCRGLTPYCNNGFCVVKMPDECKDPNEVSNLCPEIGGEGYYPHPDSCDKYNYCDAERHATEYRCPLFFVYDHSKGLCKRRITLNDCPIINCLWNRNRYIVYPPDKSLYFFCGTKGTTLQKCQTGGYNPTTNKCEFDCKTSGRFPHETDETKYYLCLDIGNNQYRRYIEKCPVDLIFSGKACVVKPTTTTIQPTISTESIPTEDTATPSPTEEVTTQGPTEEVSTQGPTEEVTTLGPTEEVATQGPTEELTTKGPTEEVATQGPTEEVATQGPTEEVTTQGPAEEVTTQGPTEEVATQGPTEEVATQGPTEEVATQGPTEEVDTQGPTEEVTTQGPTEEVATQGPTEEVATQGPTEEVHTQGPTEEVTTQGPTEEVATQGPTEEVTTQGPTEEVATQGPTEEVTTQGPTEEVATQGPNEEIIPPNE